MITYRNGDLLTSDCQIICHQVNCKGYMGAGIAKAIRDKYPNAYRVYRAHFQKSAILGKNATATDTDEQFPDFSHPRIIVNMFAQVDVYPRGVRHTDYDAFRSCLLNLKKPLRIYEKYFGKTKIGIPDHIGCGLASGDWNIVRGIIEEVFGDDEHEIEIWKLN